MIEYKGYIGCFVFNEKTNLFEGRATNVKDTLITFQGTTVENTKLDFKDAVNGYLAWCKKYSKKPAKPLPGNSSS